MKMDRNGRVGWELAAGEGSGIKGREESVRQAGAGLGGKGRVRRREMKKDIRDTG
jgi:hypothetical protein